MVDNLKIIVYTAPSCAQCKMVKKFLDSKNIAYQEIDGSQEKIREELKSLGFSSFPVVKKGDFSFSGFRPDQLRKLVN